MNPDLPQFEEGLEGWSEITLAYDLAPLTMSLPVAIQVITKDLRVLTTGIITSTEDQFAAESRDNTAPIRSVLYFHDAEPLRIEWSKTEAVLAMVAIATGEGEESDGSSNPAGAG